MKKTITILMVLAFLTFSKNAVAQSHFFHPTVINSSSCNITVSFLDGGFNVIYSNTFAPGTTVVGCLSGACAWISYSAVGACSLTIACSPGAIDNSYIANCGNCCSLPCTPFNTAEVPSGTFQTYTYPTGNCTKAIDDVEDVFELLLY
ncbi:MAG: hypothetical protein HUU47_11310 [Bacteroidetes bacterium]|nr:hypothetical protein [Bacteroidota bacterium]